MNAQEFAAAYVDEDDWGDCYGDGIKCVSVEEDVEHKTCYLTKVYQVDFAEGDEHFEVTWTRDNSGYWGDGERYPGEVRKVKPVTKMVEVTTWEAV